MTISGESTLDLPDELAIPGYRGVRRIGSGGFGDVYVATDDNSGEQVALKVLKEKCLFQDEPRRRLRLEFDLLNRVKDFHLCNVRRYGEFAAGSGMEIPYIEMDYYSGGSAVRLLKSSPNGLPHSQVMEIARQLGRAMQALHPNVVHRDIKPSNLLFDTDHNLKLSDFGLVKVVSSLGEDGITKTGTHVGTPGWIPCEMLQNPARAVTPAWDVFSAGVTLWELACGVHPFRVDNRLRVMAPCSDKADYSGTVRHEVLRGFLKNCLDRDVNRRIADAGEFIAGINEVDRVIAVFDLDAREVDGNWVRVRSQCREFTLRFNSKDSLLDVVDEASNHEGTEFLVTDAELKWRRPDLLQGRIAAASCTLEVESIPSATLVLLSPHDRLDHDSSCDCP